MSHRACIALLLFLSACATSAPSPKVSAPRSLRHTNLKRAAELPWKDGGRCVVREASQPWPVLAETCFHALDHERVRFRDLTGRCTVASADAAALGIGLCVLAAPEIAVGAVAVLGALVVAVAIKEALDEYELGREHPIAWPAPETKPEPRPRPQPSGQDWMPPIPPEPQDRERRRRCEPIPVPHRGGDAVHNQCADRVPPNRFPGMDVLVDGKHFDALQVGARVLWEVKTDQFDTYSDFLQEQVIDSQVPELKQERDIARGCGYGFVVGVSTAAHKAALEQRDTTLDIVVTGCKR